MNLTEIRHRFENCPCGRVHTLDIKDIVIKSGAVRETGEILKRNGFGNKLFLIADNNTIAAAEGIRESLLKEGFVLTEKIYSDLRTAEMREVCAIEGVLDGFDGVISVGTGSLNDIARLACARKDKPLCLFATAPSMDGFAS